MTLILTEISRIGIAMAADSAVLQRTPRPDGTVAENVLSGVVKLRQIPKLNAGISIWGRGEINYCGVRYATSDWLEYIIKNRENEYNSLEDFARLLETELRLLITDFNLQRYPLGDIGFHLAGYSDWEGRKVPDFWHIHNGFSQALEMRGIRMDPDRVNANHDMSPRLLSCFLEMFGAYVTRNGDFPEYVELFEVVNMRLAEFARRGFIIPCPPTLENRARWLRFQIQLMSELYGFSNRPQIIGGQIPTLTITPEGKMVYDPG